MWWSCNPDYSSWVLKYAMWWLIPEGQPNAGRPDPEKNGKIRYLLRINGDLAWGDTREEMVERYGKPELPYDHPDQVQPISFQGLFGTIDDNPPLKESNKLYKSNLEALPRLERERLLHGNWFAKPENASFFSRGNCQELHSPPPEEEFSRIVRSYDFASVLPHDGNRSPDYFCSVKMGKLKTGNYVVLDVVRTRITFGDWESHILENARRDGHGVDIILPEDPNAAAKAATGLLVRAMNEHGYVTRTRRATQGKLDSFRPFAALAETGGVAFIKGCGTDLWNKVDNDNEFVYRELELFDGKRRSGESGHDDIVDCCSLAFVYLAQKYNLNIDFLHGIRSTSGSGNNPFSNINFNT